MAIRVERIRTDIEAIAQCTQTPGAGATRPTFSESWAQARAYVIAQAESAGCIVRTDPAGNIHARPAELGWDAAAWLVGSHIDTVPHGGDYDGVAGVSVALELLRSAREDGLDVLPVELIVFAEEEGPTFGLGMLGSRAWVGLVTGAQLGELKNADGRTYLDAGAAFGVDGDRLEADRLRPYRYLGMIEVHIEQGPGMWRRAQKLAVVSAIAGRRQFRVSVGGEANHAGATAMSDRRDALAGTAECIVFLESLAGQIDPNVVITVGRIDNSPNAVNVISGKVEFTIDCRSGSESVLDAAVPRISSAIGEVCRRRGLQVEILLTEAAPARALDSRLVEGLCRAGNRLPTVVSGALHDSAILAPHVSTAMIFVPSRDGISHNPAEFSRVEDIAAAAAVVERVVRRPTLGRLSAMSRKEFVAAVGSVFEHSPWIADRAWESGRPVASIGDLHEKLCAVVATASEDERVALMCAHPDLVGRLAREGRLTRESSAEQAAAGLDRLSADEIGAFDRYNAAYREKFGFPFVICARDNKKDAILAAFPIRLANTRDQEIAAALVEIYKIARLRLADALWEDP